MKRLPACFLAFFLLPCALCIQAQNIYVSTKGADSNTGSIREPLATVAAALRHAREMRRLHNEAAAHGMHIIIAGGTYHFYEPLFIRPEDKGTALSPTIIEAAPGEKVIFSGGQDIRQWKKTTTQIAGLPAIAKGKIWEAQLTADDAAVTNFRQLWVNGHKAVRAKDTKGDSMNRILSWNHATGECWIPKPAAAAFARSSGAEMFIHQWWAIAILRIKKVLISGDSARLSFEEPEATIQNEHPWPAPWISKETGNSAFYLSNAICWLDEPGEWFFDPAQRKIYYWPRMGEDMLSATATVSVLENLVRIEGDIDNPVTYIKFDHINFSYTGWLRPSQKGHVPLQAGMYLLDAYKLKTPGTADKAGLENQAWIGRQPAAVSLNFAQHTVFEGCTFTHLAATGLDLVKGTQHNLVQGNLFEDIGGTGIQAGTFSEEAVETHLPFNPTDDRVVCTSDTVSNNLVTNVTNEDWGCVGIGAGYVRNMVIEHNEVSNISYSGICVGWGWTKTVNSMRNNFVHANKVHHYAKHMYDVGGLYTLSAMPGTVISENYIDAIYKAPYAHDPNHWFYYYLDEGSAYITIKNNWSPSEKVMRNSNGPGNTWENNGPQVADVIRQNAGLTAPYKYLLQMATVIPETQALNH